jgi:signal transduction histidine kinase
MRRSYGRPGRAPSGRGLTALILRADAARPARGYIRAMRRNDLLIAAGLAVASLLQVIVVYPIASAPVGVAVALGTTLPIAFRRSQPVAATVFASLVWLVPTDGYLFLGYVAAFVLYYSLAVYVPDVRVVIAVAGLGVALSVAAAAMHDDVTGEYFGALPAVVLPSVTGRVVRRLRELTFHLELERERAEHAAITEERSRIARELHDVVAHGISVIAIQADAAEAALERDPELARAPLATIRRSAKQSLEEMRHLLGVLREDESGGELAPQPGLAQVGELVEHARAAGVEVSLEIAGEPVELAPGLDLSAYRLVQEALTNVRRHAGGSSARVRMDWAPTALAIEVRDSGPGGSVNTQRTSSAGTGGSGHGIVGMRERAKLHGGEFDAGSGEGGFRVRARLPL